MIPSNPESSGKDQPRTAAERRIQLDRAATGSVAAACNQDAAACDGVGTDHVQAGLGRGGLPGRLRGALLASRFQGRIRSRGADVASAKNTNARPRQICVKLLITDVKSGPSRSRSSTRTMSYRPIWCRRDGAAQIRGECCGARAVLVTREIAHLHRTDCGDGQVEVVALEFTVEMLKDNGCARGDYENIGSMPRGQMAQGMLDRQNAGAP